MDATPRTSTAGAGSPGTANVPALGNDSSAAVGVDLHPSALRGTSCIPPRLVTAGLTAGLESRRLGSRRRSRPVAAVPRAAPDSARDTTRRPSQPNPASRRLRAGSNRAATPASATCQTVRVRTIAHNQRDNRLARKGGARRSHVIDARRYNAGPRRAGHVHGGNGSTGERSQYGTCCRRGN